MNNYIKPQAPIKNGEDYIYPVTTADQVVVGVGTENERRLEMNGQVVADDSYKLSGLAPEYYTWTDNLLLNSNFQKPYLINTNGASGSYEAWSGEKINKWWAYAAGVTFENFSKDGVTYTGGIYQHIDPRKAAELVGQTFTLGAKINGTVYAVSGAVTLTNEWHIIGSKDTATGNIRFEAEGDNSIFVVIDCSTSSLVEWAVLVPGSYTAETLPQPQWLHPRLEMIRMGLEQPKNLLVNSNFQAPYLINLNGLTEYTAKGETISGWNITNNNATITVYDDCINLRSTSGSSCWLVQKVTKDLIKTGKAYTFAIRTKGGRIQAWTDVVKDNGSIYAGGNVFNDANVLIGTYRFELDAGGDFYSATLGFNNTTSIDLEWVAVYEGAYTAETLPTPIWLHPRLEMIRMGLPVNPVNLLDNSDFTNPVNQRGYTTWTPEAGTDTATTKYNFKNGYVFDRWVVQNEGSVVKIRNGGVQAGTNVTTKYLYQRVPMVEGKPYTLVACTTDGVLCVVSAVYRKTSSWTWLAEKNTNGKIFLGIASSGADFGTIAFSNGTDTNSYTQWIAMYEGSYTLETLPPYRPKGYAVELAECQRYFERLKAYQTYQSFGTGLIQTATLAIVPVYYTEKRIAVPTVTANGSLRIKGVSNYEASAVSFGQIGAKSCLASATITGATAGQCGVLQANGDNTAYIDISADL